MVTASCHSMNAPLHLTSVFPAALLPCVVQAGRTRWLQRAYESRLFPAFLLASSIAMITLALNSSAATWAQFGYLASHSFLSNVMILDFSLLTLLSAWLVSKDAAARAWPLAGTMLGRRVLQAAMLLTPVVGPGVYLLLRPISREGGVLRRGWLRRSAAAAWAAVKYPFLLPAGGISGTVGAAVAGGRSGGQTVGRPAHSTNSRSQQGAAGPAVGAARQMVESAWFNSWSWLGQKVARFRGGGAPVASEDEGETPSQHTLFCLDLYVPYCAPSRLQALFCKLFEESGLSQRGLTAGRGWVRRLLASGEEAHQWCQRTKVRHFGSRCGEVVAEVVAT
jgi:hypothetical protein